MIERSPILVQAYQTSDGRVFRLSHRESAAVYQRLLDDAENANKALEDGKSVGDALVSIGWPDIDPVLFRVTGTTQLVIEHWQCQSTPGYCVVRFVAWAERELFVYAYGDAYAFMGPYGDVLSIRDLVRYAKDPRTVGKIGEADAGN